MCPNSLLEGRQRFILHVVTAAAAAAEPVGVGGRAPDGSVHGGLVVLRLRDHHLRRRLRGRAVALLPKLPAFLLFLVGAAAFHGGDLKRRGESVKWRNESMPEL